MQYYAKSDIGRYRSINQDYVATVVNNKNQILTIVCDGMGGHKSGEVASRVALNYIVGCFQSYPCTVSDEIAGWLEEMILNAHDVVSRMASSSIEHTGMGTTVVAAIIQEGVAYIGHVGDSRAYGFDGESLKQITKDHSLMNALLDQGSIGDEDVDDYNQKNVLIQAVGATENIVVEHNKYEVEKGLLLCSDGLYNSLNDEQIIEVLKEKTDAINATVGLIDEANKYGGRDNIGIAYVKTKEAK